MRTPIAELGLEDTMCWNFDPRGVFSVKTAYLLSLGYYENNPNQSWSRLVWSNSLPPKIKVFVWRALNNIIPTGANLKEHKVPIDGIRGRCHSRWDVTEHSLIFCPVVHNTWKSFIFWRVLKEAVALPILAIAELIRRNFSVDEYTLWCMLLWRVWSFVCEVIHGKVQLESAPSAAESQTALEAFWAAKSTFFVKNIMGMRLGNRDPQRQQYGVRVAVRNHRGELQLAAAKACKASSNSLMMEIMAMVAGITWCLEYDISPIELITDSMLAARVMACPDEEGRVLSDDILDILTVARSFMLISVNHMHREANVVAHNLAHFARSCQQPVCLIAGFPRWLRDLVSKDVS
ncbi:uncharacterized protein LOC130998624 [Salvia miltiorrhiza]|uniref:uncharacterized protein LOC130998624 n=1 Tax=Salvia miltiorrhiza TaxID=226208 RepID=UPI0025AC0C60|nr:uncharacterized protein LOC130998624 [Salvia miltiorrhiza]